MTVDTAACHVVNHNTRQVRPRLSVSPKTDGANARTSTVAKGQA